MHSKVFGKRKAKKNKHKSKDKGKHQSKGKSKRKGKEEGKRKGKEKGKSKDKCLRKEHQTRRTRNAPFAKERIVPSPWGGQLRRKQ